MNENASDRRQKWEIKLSRGKCALNSQHSRDDYSVTQSALHTVCGITGAFAGVSAISESVSVKCTSLAPRRFVMVECVTGFALRHEI